MALGILKMIAISGFLTALKCTKFVFCRGSAGPTGGAYSAHPDPLAGLRGPSTKGRERGKGEKKERGREREEPPTPCKFVDPP